MREFDEYQDKIKELKNMYYNDQTEQLTYTALGLAGETGEVLEHIKKSMRTGNSINVDQIKLEMGDVLWYLTKMCTQLNIQLSDVAISNIEKIKYRLIHGK